MPCEVMIIRNANNYSNPDPDKDRRVCRKKGYIHRTRANPNNRHRSNRDYY